MERVCEQCGKRFVAPEMGRPKRFCHARCRVAASRRRRSAVAPRELEGLARWVGWKPIQRRGMWTKMPIRANGQAASSTDSSTWCELAELKAVGAKRLGFVLGTEVDGKRLVCVDLDHCLNEAGELSRPAADFLAACPPTWVEVSPSGDGLHVWGLTSKAPLRNVFSKGGQRFEAYESGRYITVTGKRHDDAPLVLADLDVALDQLFSLAS